MVAIIVGVWVVFDSESFEACVQNPDHAQAYKAAHEETAAFHLTFRIYRHCFFGLASRVANGITALATVTIAALTVTLWSVGRDQHKASMDALKLAREEFVSTHRPRIRIREVYNGTLSRNETLYAVVWLTNVGDTNATVTKVSASIGLRDTHTKKWIIEGDFSSEIFEENALDFDTEMPSGESRSIGLTSRRKPNLSHSQGIDAGTLEVCAEGRVWYRDELGRERETGFLWVLSPVTNKFETADASRNYED